MSVKLQLFIQCDVCGRELDWKYPPEVLRSDTEISDTDLDVLREGADTLLNDLGWGFDERPGTIDKWGCPTRYRCAECRTEGRWE